MNANTRTFSLRSGIRRGIVVLVCGLLAITRPGGPVRAAHTATRERHLIVLQAYLINAKSYDDWNNQNSAAPPAPVDTFWANGVYVGIYFAYIHPHVRTDTYRLALFTPRGIPIARSMPHRFLPNSGATALLLPVGRPLTRGLFRAVLLLNGRPLVTRMGHVR